ncbi:MAG: chromate transporter, partial [Alphaproteobacteria bacterium]|nr:chromate transporter [Alphaproteobacteria bacterium]
MSAVTANEAGARAAPALPTLGEATRVWCKIGLLGFGGPAGQIALMHRELVEKRRWIGEQRFLHALNYCMLLPGPEAQQLSVYIGWLLHRTVGGLIAGILFVLPGALVMLALSTMYVLWRSVPLVDAAFFGIKAAVLAIVLEALFRIARRALKNGVMYGIAAVAFIGIYMFQIPFPLIVLGAGLFGFFANRIRSPIFESNGKAATKPDSVGAIDAVFARGTPEHARPSTTRALKV